MPEMTPMEISFLVYRAEFPEDVRAIQVFEAGWKAAESAARRRAAALYTVEGPAPIRAAKPGEANQKLIEVLDSLDEDISDLRCDSEPSAYRVKTQTLIEELRKLLCSTDPPSPAKE
jgi:hypothetical protein